MSETKHSDAPWHQGSNATSGKGLAICSGCRVLGVVYGTGYPAGKGWSPESEADARLMCAAPDLLQACKAALTMYDMNAPMDFEDAAAECERIAERCRAAIQRAEEGDPKPQPEPRRRGKAARTETTD